MLASGRYPLDTDVILAVLAGDEAVLSNLDSASIHSGDVMNWFWLLVTGTSAKLTSYR